MGRIFRNPLLSIIAIAVAFVFFIWVATRVGSIMKEPLITIGLFLNLAGAVVLAIPLLRSEKEIMKSKQYWTLNPYQMRAVMNRELAIRGMSLLVIGFLFQAVSYLLF